MLLGKFARAFAHSKTQCTTLLKHNAQKRANVMHILAKRHNKSIKTIPTNGQSNALTICGKKKNPLGINHADFSKIYFNYLAPLSDNLVCHIFRHYSIVRELHRRIGAALCHAS